jgi:hypothetical protein
VRLTIWSGRMYGGVGGEEPRGFPLSRFRLRHYGTTIAEVAAATTRAREVSTQSLSRLAPGSSVVRGDLSDGLVDPSSDFPKRLVQSSVANEIGLIVRAAMVTILCQLQ